MPQIFTENWALAAAASCCRCLGSGENYIHRYYYTHPARLELEPFTINACNKERRVLSPFFHILYFLVQRDSSLVSSSFRYRLNASCHVGSGRKPDATIFSLFNLELNGRFALDRPYSCVVTGTTFVL